MPSSSPGPRAAPALERLALSKLALQITPPGTRSSIRRSASATSRFSASSCRTHGPAMRKNLSRGKSELTIAIRFRRGGDESCEQRMRTRWTRLELGMKLTAEIPWMRLQLDDLHERAVRRQTRQSEPMLDEAIAERVGDFVTMPVPLANLLGTVHRGRARTVAQPARILAQSHRATHVGDMLLRLHERDHGISAIRGELARIAVVQSHHVARKLHDGDLHAEADAEERQPGFARVSDRLHHSLDAAHAEAARHEQAVVLGEYLASTLA